MKTQADSVVAVETKAAERGTRRMARVLRQGALQGELSPWERARQLARVKRAYKAERKLRK